MVGLFDSIHKLVARQHVFEVREGRDESRPVELSTSTILNSSTFRNLIENSRYSSYACKKLCREMNSATKMRGEDINSSQSIQSFGEKFVLSGIVSYTYVLNNERSNPDTSKTEMIVQHNDGETKIEVCCDCLYPKRMGLPCRHSMFLAWELDRQGNEVVHKVRSVTSCSLLEALLKHVPFHRWKSPDFIDAHPSYFTLKSQKSSRKNEQSSPLSPVLQKDSLSPSLNFPLQIASGGGKKAYAILLDEFKLLSETLTQSDEHLQIAKEIFEFVKSASHIINQYDRTSIRNLKLSQIIAFADMKSVGVSNEFETYGLSKRKNSLPMLCPYPIDESTKPASISKKVKHRNDR